MKTEEYLFKILFVDDEDSLFNSLKPNLNKKGVFLVRARNGEDGIQKAKTEKPDLIITDIIMPEMNGFEMIRNLKVKNNNPDIKIIILTDYGNVELINDKKFINSLGIDKYLIKSNHTLSGLIKEIENVLI